MDSDHRGSKNAHFKRFIIIRLLDNYWVVARSQESGFEIDEVRSSEVASRKHTFTMAALPSHYDAAKQKMFFTISVTVIFGGRLEVAPRALEAPTRVPKSQPFFAREPNPMSFPDSKLPSIRQSTRFRVLCLEDVSRAEEPFDRPGVVAPRQILIPTHDRFYIQFMTLLTGRGCFTGDLHCHFVAEAGRRSSFSLRRSVGDRIAPPESQNRPPIRRLYSSRQSPGAADFICSTFCCGCRPLRSAFLPKRREGLVDRIRPRCARIRPATSPRSLFRDAALTRSPICCSLSDRG